jgi:hypothetical protein
MVLGQGLSRKDRHGQLGAGVAQRDAAQASVRNGCSVRPAGMTEEGSMRRVPFAMMVAMAATMIGCAKQTTRRPAEPPAVLEVDNRNALDMNIFVVASSGGRERLGMSVAHTVSHFRIPARLIFGITPLRFQADPIGAGARPYTEQITVEPGDTIVLQIPPG